jgi:uncharacterized protein YhjY with autotransporter beta-barrel domain
MTFPLLGAVPPAFGPRAAALAALCLLAPAPAAAQQCDETDQAGGVTICGTNGGTTSQVFSPGSVIILRHEVPGAGEQELEEDGDPFDAAAAAARASPGRATAQTVVAFGREGRPAALTLFFEPFLFETEQSATQREAASDGEGWGAAAGLSLQRGGWSASLAFDYRREEVDYAAGAFGEFESLSPPDITFSLPVPGAQAERRDYGLALGAAQALTPRITAFAGARLGLIGLETRRDVISLGSVADPVSPDPEDNIKETFRGTGDTDGWSASLGAGAEYAAPLGHGLFGSASAQLVWLHERFDGYVERQSDGTPTYVFGDDERDSVLSEFGVTVSRPFPLGGVAVAPFAGAAWLHEFADDSRTVDVRSEIVLEAGDQPDDFVIRTNDPDRNFFRLGAGVGAASADGRAQAALVYETLVGHDHLDIHSLRLRLGLQF